MAAAAAAAVAAPPPRPSLARQTSKCAAGQWAPFVDDVTRLNYTEVDRICQPRNVDDVKRIVKEAAQCGRKVAMRGTKHSMGGQSMPSFDPEGHGEYVLDFGKLNSVSYDPATELVTCGPGAMWADLIRHLNEFGKAPVTMQSYATFSVGGTLSVNGHGITTDDCVSEAVVSFRLVKADGSEVTCTREENAELWSLVLGGYGMFGIMVEITMRTRDNVHMEMEYLQLDSPNEFYGIYNEVLKDEAKDVEVKIARLDVMDLDKVDLFIFRRGEGARTVSKLPREPEEMGWITRLMYKWVMPTMREERGQLERTMGSAIDMAQGDCERNQLLFVSAEPLANLWSPLLKVDDTFVLQEYFVPHHRFLDWIERAKAVYKDVVRDDQVILLNTTIRFCRRPTDQAFLSYTRRSEKLSREPEDPALDGFFAFVLYYRLGRTQEADSRLAKFGDRFIDVTLEVGGTFYLPYRLHYGSKSMQRAYPNIETFFKVHKQAHDPEGLFDSAWFRQYGLAFCTEEYRTKFSVQRPLDRLTWQLKAMSGDKESFDILAVKTQRRGFYRRLVSCHKKRKAVFEGFLVQIFNLKDPKELHRQISKAVWKTLAVDKECSDMTVYRKIQEQLSSAGPLATLATTYKQVQQLSVQKRELTRETVALLRRIGRVGGQRGLIRDYVSIGDNGKLVLPLRDALDLRGSTWVVNDTPFSRDVPVILERGSEDPVSSEYLQYDLYSPLEAVPPEKQAMALESSSADLVTMMQGLHHIQPSRLRHFLTEVYRILRPGGVFIVREHDASEELMDMLDLAHSIFNAVTGVTPELEESECRAFRSVLEWRSVVEQFGFVDAMVYEMERGDPTVDEMICFVKPFERLPDHLKASQDGTIQFFDAVERIEFFDAAETAPHGVKIPEIYLAGANKVPVLLLTLLRDAAMSLKDQVVPSMHRTLHGLATLQSDNIPQALQQRILKEMDTLLDPLQTLVQNLVPFFDKAQLMEFDSKQFPFQNYLPPELFLIYPALRAKAARGEATADEQGVLKVLQAIAGMLGGGTEEEDPAASPAGAARVSRAALLELFRRLVKASEDLRNPSELFRSRFGLTPTQRNLMREGFRQFSVVCQEADRDEAALSDEATEMLGRVAGNFDGLSWQRFSAAFADFSNERTLPPLTRSAVTGQDNANGGPRNVWHQAALAYLGSPRVVLSSGQSYGLRLSGLQDFDALYDKAKRVRAKLQMAEDSRSEESRKKLEAWMQVKQESIPLNNLRDLPNVAEVLSVHVVHPHDKVSYRSLNHNPELLLHVQKHLDLETGALRLRGVQLPPELLKEQGRARGGSADDRLERGVTSMQSAIAGTGSSLGVVGGAVSSVVAGAFGGVVLGGGRAVTGLADATKMTLGGLAQGGNIVVDAVSNAVGSTSELCIKYRVRRGPKEEALEELLASLRSSQRLQPRSAASLAHAAPFTWYKLSEWMQVEIVQQLGSSMETVPWYRFPFLQIMQKYGRVLYEEASVVFKKQGLGAAVASDGFVVSLVPGLVMALGFAWLEALALPVRSVLGSDYSSKSPLTEELVVWLTNLPEAAEKGFLETMKSIDPLVEVRTAFSKQPCTDGSLWVLEVPTFKPFTKVLQKMAEALPLARILEISGHKEVQVRVSTAGRRGQPVHVAEVTRDLNRLPGCEVMFTFQLPDSSGQALPEAERRHELSLCVQVRFLLEVLRHCRRLELTVFQVYDYWCG